MKFNEYVNASEIWSNAKDEQDQGLIKGLVRGYNVEVRTRTNELLWLSCEYISNEPEQEFNNDFHKYYYTEYGYELTGRICFRGYGISRYNREVGEYVETISLPTKSKGECA